MWNSECGMEGRASIPHSAFRIPHLSAVKHGRLVRASGRREAEMLVRACRGAAAARRARQEPLLHQERLVHFFERAGVLPHGGGDGGESHRAPVELLDDRLEDTPVHVVETELVYVQALEGLPRYLRRDLAAGAHLGVVADP